MLTDGTDYRVIRRAQAPIAPPRLEANRDGSPRFDRRRDGDYRLKPRSRAMDLGDPDPAYADRDGTRNDAGHTGGPLAPGW